MSVRPSEWFLLALVTNYPAGYHIGSVFVRKGASGNKECASMQHVQAVPSLWLLHFHCTGLLGLLRFSLMYATYSVYQANFQPPRCVLVCSNACLIRMRGSAYKSYLAPWCLIWLAYTSGVHSAPVLKSPLKILSEWLDRKWIDVARIMCDNILFIDALKLETIPRSTTYILFFDVLFFSKKRLCEAELKL